MSLQVAGWQNFYVIMGSSAGALIGLQFVVIAFISSIRTHLPLSSIRAFASPTIVHFSSVLLMAGVLNIPNHTRTSLGSLLLAIGALGLGYAGWVMTHMRRQDWYTPDHGDWLWYALLPAAAYAFVLCAGAIVWSAPELSLDIVGGSAMLLLFIGVHNAWDAAVWIIANPADPRE
jgi:hypothetical protein